MFCIHRFKACLLLIILFSFASFGATAVASGEHSEDPTMANASPALNDPLEFRTDMALFTLIVFGLLSAVLYAIAWKPLKQGLELREQTIATQMADAKRAAEESISKLKEYDLKLQSAHAQAQDLIAQARKDAESAGLRIVADAQAEATRQRDRAMADIESAKQTALSELSEKSTDIAFSLARRVVGRELKMDDHKQLISEALSKMPNRN